MTKTKEPKSGEPYIFTCEGCGGTHKISVDGETKRVKRDFTAKESPSGSPVKKGNNKTGGNLFVDWCRGDGIFSSDDEIDDGEDGIEDDSADDEEEG